MIFSNIDILQCMDQFNPCDLYNKTEQIYQFDNKVELLPKQMTSLMIQPDYLLKYILVGDANCGKTSILGRFVHSSEQQKKWSDFYQPTLGIEFGSKLIKTSEQKRVKLLIWDTAGQQQFRSIYRSYYKGAIVCAIVFDITNRNSFEHVKYWLSQVINNAHPQIRIYIVGNKADLSHNRSVSIEQAKQFVQSNNLCDYYQVSAKANVHINELFTKSIEEIINGVNEGKIAVQPQQNIGIKIFKNTNRNTLNGDQLLRKKSSQSEQSGCAC